MVEEKRGGGSGGRKKKKKNKNEASKQFQVSRITLGMNSSKEPCSLSSDCLVLSNYILCYAIRLRRTSVLSCVDRCAREEELVTFKSIPEPLKRIEFILSCFTSFELSIPKSFFDAVKANVIFLMVEEKFLKFAIFQKWKIFHIVEKKNTN